MTKPASIEYKLEAIKNFFDKYKPTPVCDRSIYRQLKG